MPTDLSLLLRDASDIDPIKELDLDAVRTEARARTRRHRARVASGAVAVVAVLGAGSLVVSRSDDPSVTASTPSTTTVEEDVGVIVRPYRVASLDQRLWVGGTGFLGSMHVYDGSASTRHSDDIAVRSAVRAGNNIVWSDSRTAWTVTVDGSHPAAIGAAEVVVPALHPDRAWLLRGEEPMLEVWADGTLVRELTLPAGATPVREVINGMLVDTVAGSIALVRPDGTEELLSRVGPVIAASDTRVLGQQGSIIDIATGSIAPLSVSGLAVTDIVAAAFSHDGTTLAVFTGPLGSRRAALHIVDVAPMRLLERHRMQSVGTPRALQWSPLGEAVYFLDDDPDGRRSRRVVGLPIGGSPQTVASVERAVRLEALAVVERP